MAASDRAFESLPAEETRDERLIAAMCRNARIRNEEISKKRDDLRREMQKIQDRSYVLEARYWTEYQARVADVAQNNPKWSSRAWISAFALQEQQMAEVVMKQQAKLREEARLKQEELEAANSEFWNTWRQHMGSLGEFKPLPSSSGLNPAVLPGHTPHWQPFLGAPEESSLSPASHSSGDLHLHPLTSTEKEMKLGKSSAIEASDINFSQTSRHLADDELRNSRSTSPFDMPTPVSRLPTVVPSKAAAGSKQQLQNHSPATSASRIQPSSDHKAQFDGVPAPPSLTPMSALPDAEDQKSASIEVAPARPSTLSLPKLITGMPRSQAADGGFAGVIEPLVGEIYQGFYKDDHCQGWWMCTPLPWDAWEREIGIKYSFQQANLFKDLPECYTTARVRANPKGRKMKTVITGWAGGFEAGGPRAGERVFPVLFFDDRTGEPGNFRFPDSPEKPFTFTKKALRALPAEWVAAADLRLPGVDVGGPVMGHETARRFRERVRARRALLGARKRLGTTPKWTSAGSSSPASKAAGSPSRQGATNDDTEMADAESLSGATAIDESTGHLDAAEATKAIEAAKILMSARNSEQNSPKWLS